MTSLTRDRDYATFVEDERALLQRCAYLLVGRWQPADELVQATLADLYARWRRTRNPKLVALRLLYTTELGETTPAWTPRARFDLVDAQAPDERVHPVVRALATLSPRQRLSLVLEWVARLPTIEVAAVLDTSVDSVQTIAREAREALVRIAPELADDAVLARRLEEAVPPEVRSVRRYDDLTHGQEVVRRRWLRRAGLLAVVIALLALVVSQVRPLPQVSTSAPVPVVTPTVTVTPSPTEPCDRAVASCQAALTRQWRATMYEVVADYLDPNGTYFNASSYYASDETEGLWRTKRGALGMEAFRLGGGATQVSVQIATDRSYAPRCGQATGNTCSSIRFMDGNRFTLSDGLNLDDGGLEGQYRPDGTDVITIIARNSGRGPQLSIDRAELVRMLQDERLRLPQL